MAAAVVETDDGPDGAKGSKASALASWRRLPGLGGVVLLSPDRFDYAAHEKNLAALDVANQVHERMVCMERDWREQHKHRFPHSLAQARGESGGKRLLTRTRELA
jgi:hypothetical protein